MLLHETSYPVGSEVPNFDFQPGKDQSTTFHQKFYDMANGESSAFMDAYKNFVRYVRPFIGEGKFLYQRIPTFRVHLPNNKAVGGTSHRDVDYGHPSGEINIVVPLTCMTGTNSLFTETRPHLKDFRLIQLNIGEFLIFDGACCEHGNFINTTGVTRVSFDFRLLPIKYYNPFSESESIANHVKFINGHYYAEI